MTTRLPAHAIEGLTTGSLADFDTTTPPTAGDTPVWDETLGKYVPGPARGGAATAYPGQAPLVDYDPTGTAVAIDTSAGHQAFPAALTTRSGKHLVAYRSGTQHGYDATAFVLLRSSTDDGATWSAATTLLNTAVDEWASGGLAQDREGTVYAAAAIRGGATEDGSWHSVVLASGDDGVTWSAPVTIDGGFSAQEVVSDIKALPDGDLVAALYGRDTGDPTDYSALAVSTDQGNTWSRRSIIKKSSTEYFHEPRLVVMPDGEILCFLRHYLNPNFNIYLTRSVDNGATWTAPRLILTAASGLPTGHLTPNGLLVLAYRDTSIAGDPCAWAVSADRGNTWATRSNWSGSAQRFVYAGWLNLADGDVGLAYALESPPNGDNADLHFMRFTRQLTETTAPPTLADIVHSGSDGDVVTVAGGVLTTAPASDSSARWEVVMTPGTSSPPVPVETPDGTDWIYTEV